MALLIPAKWGVDTILSEPVDESWGTKGKILGSQGSGRLWWLPFTGCLKHEPDLERSIRNPINHCNSVPWTVSPFKVKDKGQSQGS